MLDTSPRMVQGSLNRNAPPKGRALESVEISLAAEPILETSIHPKHYQPQTSTGNMLVRITGSDILLGATVGSSTAHRLRTNLLLESEAAGKAESVMRVPRASTSLYPLQKGGMVSQSPSQGISGTVPEHTTYPLQYKHIGDL